MNEHTISQGGIPPRQVAKLTKTPVDMFVPPLQAAVPVPGRKDRLLPQAAAPAQSTGKGHADAFKDRG